MGAQPTLENQEAAVMKNVEMNRRGYGMQELKR